MPEVQLAAQAELAQELQCPPMGLDSRYEWLTAAVRRVAQRHFYELPPHRPLQPWMSDHCWGV
eukprot:8751325-Lingulodinium_polyedra.AAC.1